MAELNTKFEVGTYIQWAIPGGHATGQIKSYNEKTEVYSIKTPAGQVYKAPKDEVSSAEVLSKDEYDAAVGELLESIKKTNKVKREEVMATEKTEVKVEKVEPVKAVDNAAANEVKALQEKLDKVMAELDEAKKLAAASAEELAVSKKKVVEMEKKAKAEARLVELKGLAATEAFGKTDEEVLASILDMNDDSYAAVLKVSTAASKKLKDLTEMSKSGLPKATDQTATALPKLTDEQVKTAAKEVAVEDAKAVASAEPEKVVSASVTDAKSNVDEATANALAQFAEFSIGRSKSKKSEKVEKDSK